MLDKMTVGSIVRDRWGKLLLIVKREETEFHWEWKLLQLGENSYERSTGLHKDLASEEIEETLTYYYEFVS